MKITTKGQVTIPQHIREQLDLLPHTEMDFEVRDDGVMLKKAKASQRRGRSLIEHMRGRGDTGCSSTAISCSTSSPKIPSSLAGRSVH